MSHDASQQAFAAAAAEFDALARRFWGAWRDALQDGGATSATGFGGPGFGAGAYGVPGFAPAGAATGDPSAWWAKLMQGSAAQDPAARFDGVAKQWYAQMQELAARFAGRDSSAGDVVEAWKRMLAGSGANPFAQMLAHAQQQAGSLGLQAWMEQAAPWLERMRGGAGEWLQLPAFGFAREHQERWQALAMAQIELQEKLDAYNALMGRVMQDALALFERKLGEREQPGLQVDSPRALFDLWIDAAEEAYAPVALGEEFRHAYAGLVDAQMRVRQAVQREVERLCALFDMPTRSELDGAHRKIVELERQVRRLRDAVAQATTARARAPAAPDDDEAETRQPVERRSRGPTRKRPAPPARTARADAAGAARSVSPTTARRAKHQADIGPATGGDVPRGSKAAAGGGGRPGAPGRRVARETSAAPTATTAKPSAKRATTSAGSRPAARKRTTREAAAPPTRRGQRTLFSATHAMPEAPKPVKKGKR